MSRKTKIVVAGLLVAGLLVLGVGGASLALAQGPTPPGGKVNMAQAFFNALASRLGITTDKLQQATIDARKDAINTALKNGQITQDQANKMLQALQNAKPGQGFGFGFGVPRTGATPQPGAAAGRFALFNADTLEAVAQVLKMKPADLTTALRNGKTLADLATSQNVDQAAVKTAIINAEKASLARSVQDGLITQDQANKITANLDPSKIDLSKLRFGRFPGRFGQNGKAPAPTPTPRSS